MNCVPPILIFFHGIQKKYQEYCSLLNNEKYLIGKRGGWRRKGTQQTKGSIQFISTFKQHLVSVQIPRYPISYHPLNLLHYILLSKIPQFFLVILTYLDKYFWRLLHLIYNPKKRRRRNTEEKIHLRILQRQPRRKNLVALFFFWSFFIF